METIKVITTGRWIYNGKMYERGETVEIPKALHDELVAQWGAGCFDYPASKKATE